MTPATTKILLVEDNPGDARLLQEAFTEIVGMRFQFNLCKTLQEALACLAKGRPDVCLLDLGLPDAQGLEAVQSIHRESSDLPIVVLTVLNDETLAFQALHEGAQDYLFKGGSIVTRCGARSATPWCGSACSWSSSICPCSVT